MAKEKLWYQCHFKQDGTETVAYIEERGAKIGNRVELKSEGYDGLWEVTNVSGPGMPYEHIHNAEERRRNPRNFGSTKGNI